MGGLCDSASPTTVSKESAGEIIKMLLVRETQTRVEDLQPLLVFASGHAIQPHQQQRVTKALAR